MEPLIITEQRGMIGWITINRAEKRNAMSQEMWHELRRAALEFASSDARALVITGAGAKAFASGADIMEFGTTKGTPEAALTSFLAVDDACREIAALPIPVIAAINGYAVGAGLELAASCSDRLGIAPEQVRVVHGDTDVVPAGNGSFASRGTATGGVAAYIAADALKQRILTVAERYFEASATDVRMEPEGLSVIGMTTRRLSWQEVANYAASIGITLDVSERYDAPHMTYPYGVHAAEVEIDTGTGRVSIARYLVVYDVGKAVNPLLVKGQIAGGVAQGLGGALFEELAYDDNGQLLSGTFIDYLLPGACEVPDIEAIITEDAPSRHNPLGVKGAGEGGTTGVGAAIANAIADALDAPPDAFTSLPIRPATIRRWLRQAAEGPGSHDSIE